MTPGHDAIELHAPAAPVTEQVFRHLSIRRTMDCYRVVYHRLLDLQRAGVMQVGRCDITASAPPAPHASRKTGLEVRSQDRQAPAPAASTISGSDAPHHRSPGQQQPASGNIEPARTSTAPIEATAGNEPHLVDLQSPPLQSLEDMPDADRQAALQQLSTQIEQCTQCDELVLNRSKTVFGVGTQRPRLCFFGEAPGADEDRQGEPFVGRAGQLLDKIIAAMTLRRDEVYLLNTLKCRPPGNRNPSNLELANCRAHWVRQLEILRPEYICCLGAVAANTLLNSDRYVGRMRGNWYAYRGAKVIVTYHPSYLLRNELAKRYVWDDMKRLMSDMGIALPK